MRKFVTFYAMAAILLFPGFVRAEPALQVSDVTYCFDIVDSGAKVSHDFVVENQGDAAVHVQQVKVSCGGCTSIGDFPKVLAPGATVKIRMTVNTTGKGPTCRESAAIITDDPGRNALILTMYGQTRDIWANVPLIEFGDVRAGVEPSSSVFILCSGASGLKAVKASCAAPGFEVSVVRGAGDQPTSNKDVVCFAEVQVRCASDVAGIGASSGNVIVETNANNPVLRRLEIPVSAYVLGKWDITPEHLFFGHVGKNQEALCDCAICTVDKTLVNRLAQLRFEADDPAISATAERLMDSAGNNKIRIRAKLLGKGSSRLLSGNLNCFLDKNKLLSIPYTAFIDGGNGVAGDTLKPTTQSVGP